MVKEFDIDVSGEDLLSKNYTICVANRGGIIKGFKFNEEYVQILNSRYGQGKYRYKKSKREKAQLKVRTYCIIIYYLFKSLKIEGEISLKICRDFDGKENDIKENLKFFLEKLLGLKIDERILFTKLDENSNAHRYSHIMRKDTKNQFPNYIKISIEDIEKFLKK